MNFSDTDVLCRLSVTVPADDLDTALLACRPLLIVFTVIALEAEPEASPNSRHGFRVHLLVVARQTDGAGEEQVLRLAIAPLLSYFGAERKQVHLRQSNGRRVAEVLPGKPVGQDPAGVRMCGLSAMVGADPFESGRDNPDTTELSTEPEPLLTEYEAEELAALLRTLNSVQLGIIAYVVGTDLIDARDLVRDLTHRVGRADSAEVGEPEITDDGVIRVAALVGATELEPTDAVATLAAATGHRGWSAPAVQQHGTGPHVCTEWRAEDTPEHGIRRLEIHAVPGSMLAFDSWPN